MNVATGQTTSTVCLYSLREWAGLAAKGNPTALHFLFSQLCATARSGEEILKHRDVFLSRQASTQFRGFAEAQLRRLQGIGAGKKGQRHELIGAHGYDIKAAMHVIRLLNEGIELLRCGTITLPRPEKELLITIRTGNYGSLDRVLNLANTLLFSFFSMPAPLLQTGLPEPKSTTVRFGTPHIRVRRRTS